MSKKRKKREEKEQEIRRDIWIDGDALGDIITDNASFIFENICCRRRSPAIVNIRYYVRQQPISEPKWLQHQ